jgi:hypothetical protein
MNKILILLISTIWLTGCSDLYNYDKTPKENPTNTTGTVGDAKDLALISGANQTGLVNTALGTAYEVKVLDSKSRPIAGDAITFTVLDQTSTPIFTQTVTTDNSGIASLNFTPSIFGQLSIKIEPANSNNVVSPLLVPVKVIGPVDSISIASGNNQTVNAGSALSAVKFLVKDANGELVPGGSANINGSNYTANSSGEISFTLSSPATSTGSYSFTGTLTNSATATVSYSVIPSTPASLSVVSGNNQSLTAGTSAGAMTAVLKDAHNNIVPNYFCGLFTSDASGEISTTPLITPTTVGSYTESITCGPLTATFNYSVSVGALASLTIVSGDNQSITAGTALANMVVVGKDAFGNLRSGDSVDFSGTPVTTNTSGLATYNGGTKNTTGSYTITASVGALSQTFNYTVTPSAPATLTILSGNNQSLTAGDTASDMVVELRDAQTNLIPNATINFGGTNKTTDSSGVATLSPGVKTTAGSFTVTATINALTQTFSYTVVPGALASLVVDSGNNQVLPRSVSSNSLQVKGYDAHSNLKSGPTLTWTDGTWSTTSVLTSGVASAVYPTPLLTGTKTITVSSGAVSTSFTLTVNNYAPLTATISTTDDLTYSVINTRTVTGADRITLSPTSVIQGSTPSSTRGWTKTGSGTQAATDSTPGSESNLNATLTNVSSPTDTLTVTSTATFPAGVTGSSCSFINDVVHGLACVVNGTMTFTRDKILGGSFQTKVQSSSSGGPEDYKLSNVLTTAKKVILEQYLFSAGIAVAGGTGKYLYMTDESYYPSVWDIDNKTITRLASNIVGISSYQKSSNLFFYNGKFIFVAADPDDSNYLRVMSYDPQTDYFAQVFNITGTGDQGTYGHGFIDVNGVLNFCSTARRNVLVASDFTVSYGPASAIGCWYPLFAASGVDYGIFTVTGTGVYRRNGTTMTKIGNNFYSGSVTLMPVTTSAYGYTFDTNGLYAINATQIKKLSSTEVLQIKALGNKVIIATKDSANRYRIFIYNEADSTYKKLKEFNATGSDFGSTDFPILGVYNGNAYLCVNVGSQGTVFQYDGTNLKQVALVSSCQRPKDTSAVVDNALWTNLQNSLTRICDSSAGCQ